MPKKLKILVVEDDVGQLTTITRQLNTRFEITPAKSLDDAKQKINDTIDLVLTDIRLIDVEGNTDGMKVLEYTKENFHEIPVVMMTAYGDMKMVIEALRLGASDFLPKPLNMDELPLVLDRVFEKERLKRENLLLRRRLARFDPGEIVGESPKIKDLLRTIEAYAMRDETILILGETGVGKELVAKAIHRNGPSRERPLVIVNVSEFNKELLGSELFGHKKGAFTGAISDRKGLLEEADGGILFIDEIGDLPLDVQVRLLRVIETKRFRRIGENEERSVDIQLVLATNKDLEEAAKRGEFREDLFHRIEVLPINVPTLRERKEDIPLLVEHFLKLKRGETRVRGFSSEVMDIFQNYPWPGNVRELMNTVTYAITEANISGVEEVEIDHLPYKLVSGGRTPRPDTAKAIEIPDEGLDAQEVVARTELSLIEAALKRANGKKTEIYKILGYTHRDVPNRRIKKIAADFPTLLREFPYLKEAYFK